MVAPSKGDSGLKADPGLQVGERVRTPRGEIAVVEAIVPPSDRMPGGAAILRPAGAGGQGQATGEQVSGEQIATRWEYDLRVLTRESPAATVASDSAFGELWPAAFGSPSEASSPEGPASPGASVPDPRPDLFEDTNEWSSLLEAAARYPDGGAVLELLHALRCCGARAYWRGRQLRLDYTPLLQENGGTWTEPELRNQQLVPQQKAVTAVFREAEKALREFGQRERI